MPQSIIDLRSDTVTKPTAGMRQAMAQAEVGDDVFSEDPTVNRLEQRMAALFGKEAAVFNCSGTQSNQMAIWAHCTPGDEILIEESGHIANAEAGAPAALSGVSLRTIRGQNGLLDVADVHDKVRGANLHQPITRVLAIENTTNYGGGVAYRLEQVARLSTWAHQQGLPLHVDGARFFNAAASQGYSAGQFGHYIDTISICFSKGLGCPLGSILIGPKDFIARARRARKLMGGGLRQSGIIAAAALYALDHHVARLAEDHDNARLLAEGIARLPGLDVDLSAVETNLVFVEITNSQWTAASLALATKEQGVLILPMAKQRFRVCTHLDVTREDVLRAIKTIERIVLS